MDTIVAGIVAVAIGALLCFRGYVTMRLVISLFGAFAGFLLGAGLFGGMATAGAGMVALGWLAGTVGAVIFGLLAYFSYHLAIIIGMAGIGFTLGTSVMAAFGVQSGFATLAVGIIAGVLLAILASSTNLPAVLLVVLTSLAGASIATSGIAVLIGAIAVDRLTGSGPVELAGGIGWTVLYIALAVLGLVTQLRAISGRHRPMRQQWGDSSRLVAPSARR
ncbi:MAG: DUF4203 domain-containing protein [Micropruina sp.]